MKQLHRREGNRRDWRQHLERIFESCDATKPGGAGMGLAVGRSIVGAHGGIWAVANEPRGAVFQFTLPGAVENRVPSFSEAMATPENRPLSGASPRIRTAIPRATREIAQSRTA